MKLNQYLLFILTLTMSCHTPAIKLAPEPLKAVDKTKAISHPDPHPENDSAVVLKTHLRDTTYAGGSFILFLRPDDARYAELEKEVEGEAGDGGNDKDAEASPQLPPLPPLPPLTLLFCVAKLHAAPKSNQLKVPDGLFSIISLSPIVGITMPCP